MIIKDKRTMILNTKRQFSKFQKKILQFTNV